MWGESGPIRPPELNKELNNMDQKLPLNPAALELEPPQGGLASFRPSSDGMIGPNTIRRLAAPMKRHYSLIPTICFNCEAACGLLAYVDQETLQVRKFEGNPAHPGSRGRNCAKGPATINQVTDPERILYPLQARGQARRGTSGSA